MVKLRLMDKQYNEFHKKSKIQKKPIKRNNFTYRLIIREVEKILLKIKRNNVIILDYGCGIGTLAFYLASKGYNITGVDVSPLSIRLCNKSAKEMNLSGLAKFNLNKDFLKKLKKTSGKFDLIICSEVIEHVQNDIKLLKKLSGILNKGGYFLLTTPSKNAPLFKMGLAKLFDIRVGHLRRYTEKDLTKKVEKASFKIIKVIKTEGIIRNSLFLFPIFGNLVRFIKGPISDIVTFVDKISLKLFGESDIYVVCQKP